MASGELGIPTTAPALIAKVKTLTNAYLKDVLRDEHLALSGPKATMQDRILKHIDTVIRNGDVTAFTRIKSSVYKHGTSYVGNSSTRTNIPPPQSPYNMPLSATRSPGLYNLTSTPYAQVRPTFKDSPFFTVMEPLTPVMECKVDLHLAVREQTRDQLECKITLKADTVDRMNQDPSLKVLLYCASDPISPFSKVDIAFPHQVEIRVNQDEVKSNLRGLKNKPGSTRPADITDLLRRRAGYENSMTVTYALTNKKFYMVVNLARQIPPQILMGRLRTGRSISREQVIREMVNKAQDADIVATSTIMSLKCPLSTLRIDMPCRSTVCTHNQCFDALSFLQLQEQAPTWTCPVCNKIVSFEALQVDQYVNDILKSVPISVDQIMIEPDGKWSQVLQRDSPARTSGAQSSSDDDYELIEIQEPRLTAIKDEALPTPISMARTPPLSSREQSTSSAGPRSTSKRPISHVIDLTYSSDEEGEAVRYTKRQATHNPPSGVLPPYSSPNFHKQLVQPAVVGCITLSSSIPERAVHSTSQTSPTIGR